MRYLAFFVVLFCPILSNACFFGTLDGDIKTKIDAICSTHSGTKSVVRGSFAVEVVRHSKIFSLPIFAECGDGLQWMAMAIYTESSDYKCHLDRFADGAAEPLQP